MALMRFNFISETIVLCHSLEGLGRFINFQSFHVSLQSINNPAGPDLVAHSNFNISEGEEESCS